MDIQKILFPKIGVCTEWQLYFRQPGDTPAGTAENRAGRMDYHYSEEAMHFRQGMRAGFDTYFNGFSIDKWKKYTVLDNLSLRLTLSGKARVTLVGRQKLHEHVIEKTIRETVISSEKKQDHIVSCEIKNARGMLAFEIEALEGGCVLYAGAYCSEIDQEKVRDIRIGVGICTFCREDFIKKNLHILQKEILDNKESPLYGRLKVHIADNGRTLDAKVLGNSSVYIYPNRNLGGAGGFTRCMAEMKKRRHKGTGPTHILLMDDDVVLEPEALVRTYMLLALAKEEYTDAFIGGEMLRLDMQAIQAEAGAVWNAGRLDSLKRGLDLKSCEACLYNEIEEYAQFHAWWYCCFPAGIVTPDNLPLPLFIRGDDVEYGLRNMKRLILMNGICVWHEPFENKYSSFLEYYIIRNQLIVNAFHCPEYGAGQLNRDMLSHCLREITYYRYKNVELYLQGIQDFLKGPQWLAKQDAETLHRKVVDAGYKAQEVDSLDMGFHYPAYEKSRNDYGQGSKRSRRLLSLNGLLFPPKGDGIVPMAEAIGVNFYRKRRVMHYDAAGSKGFITERSFWTSIRYIWKVFAMVFTNRLQLGRAQKAYKLGGKQLRTWKVWKAVLDMDETKKEDS